MDVETQDLQGWISLPYSDVNRLRSRMSTAKPISSKIVSDDLIMRQDFDISPWGRCARCARSHLSAEFAVFRRHRRVAVAQQGLLPAQPANPPIFHSPDRQSPGLPCASPAISENCYMHPTRR